MFVLPERATHPALSNSGCSTPDLEPLSKRARMKDDKETGGCCRWVQEFEGAVEELGEGMTLFEEIHERQVAMCKPPPTAPFADDDE